MRVQFIGVGEAFDDQYPNTSILVSLGEESHTAHVLLDCGFTAATAYYRHAATGADLDAVWISHFHGDHFLGLPLLLLRFWEEGRTKPLQIVGQTGVEERIWAALDLAYPNFKQRIQYQVVFHEVVAGKNLNLLGAVWSFAANDHSTSAPCLSLRLDHTGKSIFYSGDGRPTPASTEIAHGVNLLIHEAFGIESDTPGHGGVHGCLDLANKAQADTLALVHVNRELRRRYAGEIRELLTKELGHQATLPEPGDLIALE